MAWYRGGTVAVTNGSTTVTGTNTDFVSNVGVGHGFLGPDGRTIEIAAVVSATQLTLASTYQGATASGQGYSILPTTSYAIDLALQASTLINVFGAIRDGVGQGLIASGSNAAPGIRFSADQDTGVRRAAENVLSLVAGGVDRIVADGSGATIYGPTTQVIGAEFPQFILSRSNVGSWTMGRQANGSNNWSLQYNGVTAVAVDTGGKVGVGTTAPAYLLDVQASGAAGATVDAARIYANAAGGASARLLFGSAANPFGSGIIGQTLTASDGALLFATMKTNVLREVARFDNDGKFFIGTTSGSSHVIARGTAEGDQIIQLSPATSPGYGTARFYLGAGNTPAGAGSCFFIDARSNTNRSINAAGTINASGADYAEYIRKAAGCGTIAKGDVCGIDRDGLLVRTWTEAIRFVVKSTDPNLVGGDTWAAHLGAPPEAPAHEPPVYDGPAEPVRPDAPTPFVMPVIALPEQPTRDEGEDDEAFIARMAAHLVERSAALAAIAQAGEAEAESAAAQARYAAAVRQYEADLAAYITARRAFDDVEAAAGAAHDEAMAAHATELAAWEADLEAARRTVDRVAFCGQVPVNVDADTLAACERALADGVAVYLVAVARGAGIGVVAVREDDMTLAQYMRRVGCVWAIRDGRPWVDVQHG